MVYKKFGQVYMQTPFVTRAYITACVITTLAVELGLVSPSQLYFNPLLTSRDLQLWRPITAYLFFGRVGVDFFLNMMLAYHCCRVLEEGSFRGHTADLLVMLNCGVVFMVFFALIENPLFFGRAVTLMLLYVWSRRTALVTAEYGFIVCKLQAKYVPWMLIASSVLSGNAIWVDLVGVAAGHTYYFLEDVLPQWCGGFRLLEVSPATRALFDPELLDLDHNACRKIGQVVLTSDDLA